LRRINHYVILAVLSLAWSGFAKAEPGALTVYPALPDNHFRSGLYEVTVSQGAEGYSSYVYQSTREADNPYNKSHTFSTDANHWTSFSFTGAVRVRIKLRGGAAIKTATVHPLSRQIPASVVDNTVTFTLTHPANVFVELDSTPRNPLFIFANPAEVDVPTAGTPNVIYFGPGLTDLGNKPLSVANGQTVYLAGGAYVKGRLQMARRSGPATVTVRGRGILSGIDLTEGRGTFSHFMIDASSQKPAPELRVEGIVIADSPGPCVIAAGRLTAENIKLLCWARCSDGIAGGAGSLVKDCFLKTNDDNIHFHVTGMRAIDNVVWLQAAGSALMMGWNVTADVNGELADGLDIIGDDLGRKQTTRDTPNHNAVALMDIHGHAAYRNIVIKNIRYDGQPYQIFGIRTMLAAEAGASLASYRQGLGRVDGMLLKDVTAPQPPLRPSVFDGNGGEPGTIQNVTFENIQIDGNRVTEGNAATYVIQRGKTSGFRFDSSDSPPPGSGSK
jgi:hypothetical protein